MLQSSLGNTKEAHLVVVEDSKQKEDVKLYGKLPDYDDFQCYYLGRDDILRQIALGIYDNLHRPSWQTLKHHLFTVKNPKKYFRKIKELSGNDKKDEFKQERMFGRVAKNTHSQHIHRTGGNGFC